jgi:TPR repeat protein
MAKWSPEELKNYRTRAEAGDIEAQIYLGWAFLEGKFVEKDCSLAKEWLERASNQGSKEAGYRLAMLLISQKDKNGIGILTSLSAANFASAAYELGNCYYVGLLVERDENAAVQEWSHATDSGHAIARIKLLKYQSLRSPFYMKPFIFIEICWAVLSAGSLLLKDFNDTRTLGTIR